MNLRRGEASPRVHPVGGPSGSLQNFISGYGITSSSQLIELSKELNINLKFIGLTKDLQAMNPITNGSYIINIGDGSGTHWTCLYIKNQEGFYYDSYAVAPENDLIDILNTNSKVTKIIYNNDFQFQGLEEQLCGIYCLMFLYHMTNSKKKSLVDGFNDFAKSFKDLD